MVSTALPPAGPLRMQIRCPHCQNPLEVIDDDLLADKTCPACGSSFSLVNHATAATHVPPGGVQRLGHFELIEQIGVVAFGSVWKAGRIANP